jgi:hypothetical protein
MLLIGVDHHPWTSSSTPLQQRKSQIRMVEGFTELIEREETLVAAACNHPNCLVLPVRLELIRLAA